MSSLARWNVKPSIDDPNIVISRGIVAGNSKRGSGGKCVDCHSWGGAYPLACTLISARVRYVARQVGKVQVTVSIGPEGESHACCILCVQWEH
jgi:hypothetical protein